MRLVSKIAVAAAAAVTVISAGLAPALADPPAGVTPKLTDVVGVGADTTQYLLDAIATKYDATSPADELYSWNSLNPVTGQFGDTIITKASSLLDDTCSMTRPFGSLSGVIALSTTKTDAGHPCVDYAGSSAPPSSTTPSGLVFVGFAKDALSWVTTTKATGTPASLTAAQLNKIYSANTGHCLTWKDVGGTSTATIVPVLPQTSSGTRSLFLAAISVTTPGTCVDNGIVDIPGDPYNPVLIADNTGISQKDTSGHYLTGNEYEFDNNPNAIFPYSAADWIAQQPTPAGGGHATKSFGPGVLTEPKEISGISPITAGKPDTISTKFTTSTATRIFNYVAYNVVPNVGTAADPKIASGPITTIFGPKGVVCSDTAEIKSYGFLPLPVIDGHSLCGLLMAG
jgi:ABC-type phosphate transport system substrate-binding protein